MKHFLRYIFLLVPIWALIFALKPIPVSAQSDAGWEITNFHSDITLNPQTIVDVTETIDVDFRSLDKHGIYRNIPIKYSSKLGNSLNIRFKLKSITNSTGQKIPVSASNQGNVIQLKIGDPDHTISGKQTYIIKYHISRVITRPNEHAEFYWNVTGEDWPVIIKESSVTINAPDRAILNSICFTGRFGSQNKDCISIQDQNTLKSGSKIPLRPGEGFTLAVSLDQGKFQFPTPTQELIQTLQDNWPYIIPLFTLIAMLRLYWVYGRDKQYKNIFHESSEIETVPLFQSINPQTVYAPLNRILPGEAGTLVDETANLQDITATIIDLARRGHINIKELPKSSFFGKTDYEFTYKEKDESKLAPFEISILNLLFNTRRERTPVLISKLKDHLDTRTSLSEAKDKLYEYMVKQGYFYSSPNTTRTRWLIIGLVLAGVGVGLLSSLGIPWAVAAILSGIIIAIFSPFMAARTPKGRKLLREIVGLKEWIRIGAWREQIHEKHNFFEEVLPFTIAFGLTQKFINALNDAELKEFTQSTGWFHGSPHGFSNSFSSLNSSINSSVASISSASSGGSGFSGGGSGGGFGGGGGGSW